MINDYHIYMNKNVIFCQNFIFYTLKIKVLFKITLRVIGLKTHNIINSQRKQNGLRQK